MAVKRPGSFEQKRMTIKATNEKIISNKLKLIVDFEELYKQR